MLRRGSSKYAPLTRVLLALPAEQAQVRYTLAYLEAIISDRLPFSAKADRSYWTHSATAQDEWQAAGWQARLDCPNGTVTFTRR